MASVGGLDGEGGRHLPAVVRCVLYECVGLILIDHEEPRQAHLHADVAGPPVNQVKIIFGLLVAGAWWLIGGCPAGSVVKLDQLLRRSGVLRLFVVTPAPVNRGNRMDSPASSLS
jgi:hypothetical protein